MSTSSTAIPEMEIDRILSERFRLPGFRHGQREVISRLLAGRSAAAIFPTGGGKSLCYQLPAVALDGLTLVVSPLLALMREQVDQLRQLGIGAARLDSSLTAEESRQVMQQVRSRQIKLLYVAPERFFNERFRQFIQEAEISLFAVDEAHCISQWGHNFRPDYLKLAKIAVELNAQRVLALTATATPQVLQDIRQGFDITPQDAIQTPFYRSNLTLRFTPCKRSDRDAILLERLSNETGQPTLVYVTLQKTAEMLAERLSESGLHARAYHAGIPADERAEIQDWFMTSDSAVVVATIAFGMGIDKSNIRAIYHYNASKSVENYAQEIGRAGRDGQPALCETLIVPEDRIVLDNFAYGDTPTLSGLRKFVDLLAGQPERFFISYYSLAYETDIRESVIRTLMTYLELDDWLAATAPRYEKYQFKPLLSSTGIINHFSGERRDFATSVLAMTVKKKVWCEINLPQAADRLKCDRDRIVRMLDYFAEQGWMELKVSGLVHGYRVLKPVQNRDELTQQLYQYVLERENGELARLNELFDLYQSTECQSAALSKHFGQDISIACGHCSVCEGKTVRAESSRSSLGVGDAARSRLRDLSTKHPEALGELRQQARFLCGLSSPKLTRSRLTRDPHYGCCASIPFDRVMESLERM